MRRRAGRLLEPPGELEAAQIHEAGQIADAEVVLQVLMNVVTDGPLLRRAQAGGAVRLAEQHVDMLAEDVHPELAGQGLHQEPAAGSAMGRLPGQEHRDSEKG